MAKGETYKEFVEKFEHKHTTDDCYTPANIYDAVAGYVEETYGRDRDTFVRPFWPGGDYENFEYPAGCVVVDNPPFSIMSKILKFYREKKIDFFLFANGLTTFSGESKNFCSICTCIEIIYENGAHISTSFITNLDNARAKSAPELYRRLSEANKANSKTKKLTKRTWPDNLLTCTKLGALSRDGIEFSASKEETEHIRKINGDPIFGSGYLIKPETVERLKEAALCKDEREVARLLSIVKDEATALMVAQALKNHIKKLMEE